MLTEALVGEVRRLSAALIEALYVPVEQRVWRRVNELVELFGGDVPVVIPLTQDDIAQLAGTTRPTANRALRAGEEQGVLRLARGRIEVHDRAALKRLPTDLIERRSRYIGIVSKSLAVVTRPTYSVENGRQDSGREARQTHRSRRPRPPACGARSAPPG